MKYFSKLMVTVFLPIIFIVLPHLSAAQGDEPPGLPLASWTELVFKGSKLMTRITVKIKISSDDLSGSGDCSETVPAKHLLTVESASKGIGSSAGKYEEKIWFKETASHPIGRVRVSSGDDPWVKSYCWEDEGVRRQRILPANSNEKKQSSSEWTKRSESLYQYPKEVAGCNTISDPSLVFYMLATQDFDKEKTPLKLCVFGRKQLHQLTIRQEEKPSLKVSYKARSASGEVAVEEKVKPIVFSIVSEGFAPENRKAEAYSFLGLNKDIRIYMDPEKRLPVRISGTNNSVGDLVLDLKVLSE